MITQLVNLQTLFIFNNFRLKNFSSISNSNSREEESKIIGTNQYKLAQYELQTILPRKIIIVRIIERSDSSPKRLIKSRNLNTSRGSTQGE